MNISKKKKFITLRVADTPPAHEFAIGLENEDGTVSMSLTGLDERLLTDQVNALAQAGAEIADIRRLIKREDLRSGYPSAEFFARKTQEAEAFAASRRMKHTAA